MVNPDDFRKSLQAVDALGATPAVLVKAAELAKDPNTDLESICELLRNDGPLAAEIIRLSNSSYFAPPVPHSNLTSALHYIGMREVYRVVNLSLARRLFARDLPGYGIPASDYWSASVAAALVMEAAAKQTGLNSEDAYTIGILHAIGRVFINQVIEEQRFTVYWDGHQPIRDWERSAVGFDYAEAGAMLLAHWHFPAATCEVLRCQIDSEKAGEVTLVGSLQFTLRLLALTGLDFENKDWQIPESDPFMRATGLTPAVVSQFTSACRDNFQRIRQSVDLS
jgi:HD-like signal output (HDOD) protein